MQGKQAINTLALLDSNTIIIAVESYLSVHPCSTVTNKKYLKGPVDYNTLLFQFDGTVKANLTH